jgi:hypothetical protein
LGATRWDETRGTLVASGRLEPNAKGDDVRLVVFHPGADVAAVRATVRGLERPTLQRVAGGGVLVTAHARGGAWSITVARAG